MFVRFRQSDRRLQASLAETRRQDGKVRHEHVAGLGSVPIALSPTDRLAFWTKLHQRLDALSNRVDAAERGAILTAIHTRIPMPTLDDQQTVQLERARADAEFWSMLADGYAEQIDANKELLAKAQRAIAEREPLAADTASKAQAAKERLVRVEKGETVAGIGPPLTRKDVRKMTGMTEAQLRHCERVAGIGAAGEGWWRLMTTEQERRSAQIEKAVVRKLHRMVQQTRQQ
jgi:hypothetical protein